jgi:hypothetical protein
MCPVQGLFLLNNVFRLTYVMVRARQLVYICPSSARMISSWRMRDLWDTLRDRVRAPAEETERNMQTTYVFHYFISEGSLLRITTRPCADLREAIRLAVRECGLCERLQVSAEGKALWSGSPAEALTVSEGARFSAQDRHQRTG